jgi:23S rRNA (guanine745-N1)-methyltransferase
LPLARRDRALSCPAGHSFDIARSGYVNLLQPHDRRSAQAGDASDAIAARAALERASVGRAIIDAVIRKSVALTPIDDPVVVDLGSGTGEMLGRLSASRSLVGVGIDLSAAAVDFAARRFPSLTWVVANADRRLPLIDRSVDLVLSIHGRRNAEECARVLNTHGALLVVQPSPDDLRELRAHVQGEAVERDRVEAMLAEHQTHFDLVKRVAIGDRQRLEREALMNLLRGTYRGARFKLLERIASIEAMDVTLSSEMCVLKPKSG